MMRPGARRLTRNHRGRTVSGTHSFRAGPDDSEIRSPRLWRVTRSRNWDPKQPAIWRFVRSVVRGARLDVTEGGSAARRSHGPGGRGAHLERGGLELCPCDDKEGPVWFTPAGHPGVVHRSSPATGGCEHSSVAAWSEDWSRWWACGDR